MTVDLLTKVSAFVPKIIPLNAVSQEVDTEHNSRGILKRAYLSGNHKPWKITENAKGNNKKVTKVKFCLNFEYNWQLIHSELKSVTLTSLKNM